MEVSHTLVVALIDEVASSADESILIMKARVDDAKSGTD